MTYPITPNPGIHNPPTQSVYQTGAGSSAQLQALAKQLPMAMTLDLVNALLDGLGLSEYTAQADGALTALSTAVSDTSSNATTAIANWEDFFEALGVGDLPGLSTLIGNIQAALNGLSAALQQSWLNVQSFFNGIVGDIDSDVTAAIAAWTTFTAALTDIIDSFAPGGTSAEFLSGVTNLLALFGLTPSSVGGATVINTVWTDVINDIINPLNALEVQAANIIGDIEISAINGLATALSALLGTTIFQTLLDSVANALGHSGTGHTVANIETYLGLIPPANVGNVLGGSNLGADVTSVHTTASDGVAWVTRVVNDLLITSDVFHLIYPVGTPSDPPGTTSGGKPTWYSCWNDLLDLTGTVNSVTPPTDTAPAVAAAVTSAQSGADAANSNASTALTQLMSIPAQTVAPDLSGGASSVSFDHAGSGGSATNGSGSVSTPLSCTGTQTIGASASIMVAAVTFSLVGTGTGGNAQIGIGTQQMQSLGTVQLSSVTEFIEFFILWNPPVGTSQTVTATGFANPGVGQTGGVGSVSFESASYIGVTNISNGLIINSGTGTSLSLSVSGAIANTMAVAAFTAGDVATKANTALSSYTKTQRGNTTVQVNSTQFGYQSLAFGDTTGTSGGVTFGATGADSFAEWAGVGIVLSATSVIGSGFRAFRTSNTPESASSGNNQFFTGYYGLTDKITADYSYASSTNTLTVANAGWYMVKINFLTDGFTSFLLGPILYQNGSVVQAGNNIAPTSGATVGDTFIVYCSAGDTLTPGYFAGTSFSTTFIGESTGTKNTFSVSLLNRSLL